MTKDQHAQITQVAKSIMERNINNTMTPELATGIVNMIAHETGQLVDPEPEPEDTEE